MVLKVRTQQICILCIAAFLSVVSACEVFKNATCITDVRAIRTLGYALNQRNGKLRGWNSTDSKDPCGYSDCAEESPLRCNYQGVTCENWRIVKIELDCHASKGLCGSQLRMPVPAELLQLSALTHLQLANMWIAGSLPPWTNWPSLTVLNLSGNMINGPLPSVWESLGNLQVIDLSENELGGKLPTPWYSMQTLRTLALQDNRLQGTIPPDWIKLNLDYFDVRNNCGLCGALVNFGNATTAIDGSNIGGTCHAFNCNSQFFAHIMIIISLVFGVLALCLLQRHLCMRCRNRQLRDRMAAGLIGQPLANQAQDASATTASHSLKLSQLAVVVMPDGQTVAFGRKLSSDNLERSSASSTNLKTIHPTTDTDTTTPTDTTTRPPDTHTTPSPLLSAGGTTTITIIRESDIHDESQPPRFDVSALVPEAVDPDRGGSSPQVSPPDNPQARSWIHRRLQAVRPALGLLPWRQGTAPPRRAPVRSVAPTGMQVTGMRFDAYGNPV